MAKLDRLMEPLTVAERREVLSHAIRVWSQPLSDAERASRYRDRKRHGEVTQRHHGEVTQSGHATVTFPPAPPDVSLGSAVSSSNNGSKRPKAFRTETFEVLKFLNEMAGKSFRPVPANLKFIEARLASGATVSNCKGVIARKVREWKNDPENRKYLRPETLFNETKFEQYLGEREPDVRPAS